jgi:hypothetical protein
MRIGTATVVAALALALAGCGDTTTHPAARDIVVPATDSVTVPLGPGSNPHAVVADNETPGDDDEIVRPPIKEPTCPGGPTVHFDTPEAAMTYLAAAWNRNDLAALCQVTNPNARFELNDMHREAVNLRLKSCDQFKVGYYNCTFIHDYPARMHKSGTGRAWLVAAAADNPGWYMTIYEGCG